MVSPIAQINRNRQLAQGVTWTPPIGARQLAPVIPLPRRQPAAGGDLADRLGAAASDILTNPAFDRQPAQGGGFKESAVHGLGWVIGNPVSKAILKPLEVLDYPRAAVVSTLGEAFDVALPALNKPLGRLPFVEPQPYDKDEIDASWDWGDIWENTKAHAGFGTEIVEPIMGPEGTDRNIWARRLVGFIGDIATDPLLKLGSGTRAASGLENRFSYLNKLLTAQKGAEAESLAAREAAEFAAEHALLGGTGAAEATAATRAAAEAAAARQGALGGNEAIDLISRRGVNLASPEQLAAMGAQQHAIRFAEEPIENLVRRVAGERAGAATQRGSEAASRAMSKFLSPGKELWSRTAGQALRSVPMGEVRQTLRPATERLLKGEGPMSAELALRTHGVNEVMRLGAGDFRAPAREYVRRLGADLKGMSREDRAELVRVAEELGVENAVTGIAPQMIETMKEVYRSAGIPEDQLDNMVAELKPWKLPNGEMSRYVMPHVLSRDAFRFFNRLRKGQNPLLDYIRRDLGITDKDLLEESGFMQRRLFRPEADGSPKKFKIGEEEIEITTGSAAELEDKLGGLLRKHGFEGKLYETDPVEAWRRYVLSTEKDVARRVGEHVGAKYGIEGWKYKAKAPRPWDPYGREIAMVPAEGETEPRYVRGRTTEQRPELPSEYQWVPDEEATKARNKIITEGGEKGTTAQVLGEYGEAAAATRENLATKIEHTREYTATAFGKVRERSAKALERAQGVVDSTRASVDRLETEYRELLKESSANEELRAIAEGKIHGVKSQTPKRIKRLQQQRLADIAESLQQERDRLQWLQKSLEDALSASEQKQIDDQLERIATIDQNLRDAEVALSGENGTGGMRARARRAIERKIRKETQGREGLIDAVEADRARNVLGNQEAAARAQELLARKERYAVARDARNDEARKLSAEADRIEQQLNSKGVTSTARTPERQARLDAARAEMEDQIARLRREATSRQRMANSAATEIRNVERRIKDDGWLRAQELIRKYDAQQGRIANYSDAFGVDMPAAQSRLNAAQGEKLRFDREQELAAQQAVAEEAAAMEAASRQPIPALEEIIGPDAKVRFRTVEAAPRQAAIRRETMDILAEELGPIVDESQLDWVDSIHTMSGRDVQQVVAEYWDRLPEDAKQRLREVGWENGQPVSAGEMPGSHIMEVSRGEDAIASMMWRSDTGEVQTITVAEPYREQGIATSLYDQATQYAKERAYVPPKHSELQTEAGAAWATKADERIANKPESTFATGTESEAAKFARRSLDTDEARAYRADETLRSELRDQIERVENPRMADELAEWQEVGRKVVKEPRANQRWRAYNSRRRKLLGDMERVRGEKGLSAPPSEEALRAESYRRPKPRTRGANEPKWMEEYRSKPSTRRLRGKEPWWTEEYPSRPDLTSSARSRNARLKKLQDELNTVERWLDKHPQPPMPRPTERAVRLRAKIGGKVVRLERESSTGALGAATWKIKLADGIEQAFTGDMAEAMRMAERTANELGRAPVDEAALADLRQRLAQVEERMATHRPELVQHIKDQRLALAQSMREQALIPPKPIPPPTPEELIRKQYEPQIEQAASRVKRYASVDARRELEGIRRTEQIAANERIGGLQGQIETINYEQQRMHSMITDLYQNRMPDPVNDWRAALDNAEQARQAHAQIEQYIEKYATRQRALDIVERNARKGAPTAEDLKRVASREMRAEDAQGLIAAVDDVNKWMSNAGHVLPKGVRDRIEAALMAHEQALATLTTTNDLPASALAKIQREAMNGKLAPVLKAQLRDAFKEVGADGEIIIDKNLARMMFGVEQALDSKLFGRLFTTWTNFFKTYATLTPGFHVRNAISAIFMNATEGVTFREQMQAMRLWKAFRNSEDPVVFLRDLPTHQRDAFRATFASGAGGQFVEGGVGEARGGVGKMTERLFSNPATRLSKRGGEWVEGPQRLALGLHTTANGGSAAEALGRITRVHFDYAQVSKFDENMKRIIPFWTFMSRNVPLQFTQMWLKPRTYLKYQTAIRNLQLGNEDQPIIPDYISQAGGAYFGVKTPEWASKIPFIGPPEGMPIVVQPDLPQQRYFDDLQRATNALSGQGLGQMATNLNPLITTPAEFVSRTDFFTGQRFDPEDMVKVGGATLPYAAALSLVGLAQRGPDGNWYIDAAALNAARGLDPNLDKMMRLLPGAAGLESVDRTGASTTARQAESWARYAGLPFRTITPQQQRSAVRSKQFAERDRQRKLAAMGG